MAADAPLHFLSHPASNSLAAQSINGEEMACKQVVCKQYVFAQRDAIQVQMLRGIYLSFILQLYTCSAAEDPRVETS